MKYKKDICKKLSKYERISYYYEFFRWYIVLNSLTECYITKYTEIKPQKLDINFFNYQSELD